MTRRLRLDLRTFAALVLVAAVVAWALAAADDAGSQTPAPSPTITVAGTAAYPTTTNGMVFVAVIGSDSPTGAPDVGGGCDAIHIIAVNPATHAGTVLNMPRDTYIGGRKITDICRANGFDAGIQTIHQLTGIPIQFYAHTNFSNFIHLMDTVGGLDIHVYQYMVNPGDTGSHWPTPGTFHMQGGDLLAFSRDRYNTPGGDFGRSEDQAQIIMSGLRLWHTKSVDLSYMFDLIRAGRQSVAFTIPLPDIVRLAMVARAVNPANINSCTLNGVAQTLGGASVVVLNGDDAAIWNQVAKDGSLPPHPDCFQGVNFQIPPG